MWESWRERERECVREGWSVVRVGSVFGFSDKRIRRSAVVGRDEREQKNKQ